MTQISSLISSHAHSCWPFKYLWPRALCMCFSLWGTFFPRCPPSPPSRLCSNTLSRWGLPEAPFQAVMFFLLTSSSFPVILHSTHNHLFYCMMTYVKLTDSGTDYYQRQWASFLSRIISKCLQRWCGSDSLPGLATGISEVHCLPFSTFKEPPRLTIHLSS